MAATVVAAIYLPMLRRVARAALRPAATGEGGGQGVSVIVYTYANAKGLAKVVESLRAQDYDGPWEVVVVNDGKDSAVADYLTIAGSNAGQWLRSTFTPPDGHSTPRKKLALTLGIKAARYPSVLLLTSESRLPGPGWLRAMAAPLCSGDAELVVGYAGPSRGDMAQRRLMGRRMRRHMLLDDAEWLGDALAGRTWRADGDNMGMRRTLFFDHAGYGNSLDLEYGDDDVFVSEAATRSNTATVLAASARVATEAPADAPSYYRHRRARHVAMEPYCSRLPRARRALAAGALWLWLTASAAVALLLAGDCPAAFSPERLQTSVAALGGVALAALLLWAALAVAFNRVSTVLTGRHLRWTVVGTLLTHYPRRRRHRDYARRRQL